MKITQTTLSKGITINMGQYESERFDIAVTAELDKGESLESAAETLSAEAKRLLALELMNRISAVKEGQESYLDKILRQPVTVDGKLRQLERHPFYNWILRLHPAYADSMAQEIRESMAAVRATAERLLYNDPIPASPHDDNGQDSMDDSPENG
jgi:hypothetical protein